MSAQSVTEENLRRIVCPVCHQSLQLEAAAIRCQGCGKRYPIVDGVPVLLADRAIASKACNFPRCFVVASLERIDPQPEHISFLTLETSNRFLASNNLAGVRRVHY